VKGDLNDTLQDEGRAAVRARLDGAKPRRRKADNPPRVIPIVPFEGIRMNTSARYHVDGILPLGGLTVIWGPPKSGKSFFAFDLMMHVALGWMFRDREVEQGAVVYCAFEAGHGFADRVEAFRRRHLAGHKDRVPFWLVAVPIDLVGEHAQLIAAITQAKAAPAVVVLDTLNRSLRGSESKDDDMGAYVQAADAIREALACAVVIVHHSGIEANRPRGHTSLIGAVDASISIKRGTDGLITMTVDMMRDGQAGAVLGSRLENIDVGEDLRGRTITSCVVVAAEADKPPRGRPAGSPKQLLALQALEMGLSEAGQLPPSPLELGRRPPPEMEMPSGPGSRVVTFEKWLGFAASLGVVDGKAEKWRQAAALRKISDKLITKRQVGFWEGFAWKIGGSS
jgi:hypothetical protein